MGDIFDGMDYIDDNVNHIGDDAELYALGALDDVSARRVEQHIAACPECAARVNDALLAAAALAEALPAIAPSAQLGGRLSASAASSLRTGTRRTTSTVSRSAARTSSPTSSRTATRPSTGWFSDRVLRYAVAAALVLALLNAGWQSFRFHREIAVEDVALSTLVHSHFNHVSMTSLLAGPLAAKILYARDGSWIYVIADRPGGALRALGYGAGKALDFGTMPSDGKTAALMVHPRSRVRRIVLERGNVPVAEATLAY
jgi:anti-sigma factor ChrR (cupin superfamily)